MTTLGRTGVQVSRLCFGAMLLGRWGTEDENECVRMVHRALDAGINFIDTADVYGAGDSESILGKALAGRRDDRPRDQAEPPVRRGLQPQRQLAPLDHAAGRRQPPPPQDRLDRPLPAAPPRPVCDIAESLGALTDLVRAGKVRYIGSSTFPPHRSSRRTGPPSGAGSSASPASSRRTRCSCAGSRPTCCRCAALRHGRHPVEPVVRGLARPAGTARAASCRPRPGDPGAPALRHVAAGEPRKLEAVEQLAELAESAGLTLPQLALGFIREHPA